MTQAHAFRLRPHPSNPGDAIREIVALVRRHDDILSISFRTLGRREEVRWPIALPSGFSDGLWQHSCFEAFVGVAGDAAYVELNMAPSKRWAAYRFDSYRAAMRRADAEPLRPFIWFEFDTTLMARWRVGHLPADATWQLGLSAVIETRDGAKNYFALAHAPGNPDFHNRDCFIATLPAPEPS